MWRQPKLGNLSEVTIVSSLFETLLQKNRVNITSISKNHASKDMLFIGQFFCGQYPQVFCRNALMELRSR